MIQDSANDLVAKSDENKFKLNESKEMRIYISFVQNEAEFAHIVINGKAIVSSAKLLGLNISKDLKWNCHGSDISRKVSARLFFLNQLRRVSVATEELMTFYTTCIRSCRRVRFSSFFIIHSRAGGMELGLTEARYENYLSACHP